MISKPCVSKYKIIPRGTKVKLSQCYIVQLAKCVINWYFPFPAKPESPSYLFWENPTCLNCSLRETRTLSGHFHIYRKGKSYISGSLLCFSSRFIQGHINGFFFFFVRKTLHSLWSKWLFFLKKVKY